MEPFFKSFARGCLKISRSDEICEELQIWNMSHEA